mmetsp:Transcript_44728/g.117284  ORF Transcript_44728/g.117284 Transcript_44728/m.117284 type:complete len:526 (-) Transcript_44728:166-1743(-)
MQLVGSVLAVSAAMAMILAFRRRREHQKLEKLPLPSKPQSSSSPSTRGQARTFYATNPLTVAPERVVIAMVGLPARGKSYISKAVVRYLTFIGCPCEIFNAGNKRRTLGLAGADASFFDDDNKQAKARKEQMALETLEDLFAWLQCKQEGLACGIFDATNTTMARRKAVAERCARESPPIKLIFLESVCDDDEILSQNYRMKLINDDYKGASTAAEQENAMRDFMSRVQAYEAVYENVTDEELAALNGSLRSAASTIGYLQVVNAGRKLIASECTGTVCNHVLTLLQCVHLVPRKVTLVLAGESENDRDGIRGGDTALSAAGMTYSRAVCSMLCEREDASKPRAHVLSGTLRRYMQLADLLRQHQHGTQERLHFPIKALNEMHFGSLEGLPGGRLRDSFPEEFHARAADKLKYRYPGAGGESYLDLIVQLRPIVLDIERSKDDLAIVCDVAVARVLVAYFEGVATSQIPDIPMSHPGLIEFTRSHSGFTVNHVAVKTGVPGFCAAQGASRESHLDLHELGLSANR